MKTFSIGFGERSFDESAARAARRRALRHRPPRGGLHARASCSTLLPDGRRRPRRAVRRRLDPADVPPLPLHARAVTVALGGDGGDELLAGYPTFAADRVARLYRAAARCSTSGSSSRSPTAARLDDELQPRLQAQAVPPRRRARPQRPARHVARLVHAGRAGRAARRTSAGDPVERARARSRTAPTTRPARATDLRCTRRRTCRTTSS